MNIGAVIKKHRKDNHVSQKTVADALGYTDKTAISQIERGVNQIPLRKFVKLCEVIGVDPCDLLREAIEDSGHADACPKP